jgi:hypothetical protein
MTDSTTKKATRPSFNQWLEAQGANARGAVARLAAVWTVQRGRMTATSVEARAVALGAQAGDGIAAYSEYQAAHPATPAAA